MPDINEVWLVLTTLPTQDAADALSAALIENRLAACVTILPASRSIYRWQGKIESAQEVPILIKTTCTRYPALEKTLRNLHPYEIPEIIAVPLTGGLPAYLAWVHAETSAAPPADPSNPSVP